MANNKKNSNVNNSKKKNTNNKTSTQKNVKTVEKTSSNNKKQNTSNQKNKNTNNKTSVQKNVKTVEKTTNSNKKQNTSNQKNKNTKDYISSTNTVSTKTENTKLQKDSANKKKSENTTEVKSNLKTKQNEVKNNIEKKKNQKLKKIIMILLILVFVISSIMGIKYYLQLDNDTPIIESIYVDDSEFENEEDKRILQVQKLKEEYPDVIGYIEIEGTSISYPVMQTDNNDYYVNHAYDGKKSDFGALFLDKDYDFSLPSSNLLIYGHNNREGIKSMFAELLSYKDEKFYKNHSEIRFTTEEEDSIYDIIAVFESRVYFKYETDVFRYYYFINAKNEKEYNEYVKNSKDSSLYDIDKTAQYPEQLMTLSTCAYHTEDGRFVVVAKKRS